MFPSDFCGSSTQVKGMPHDANRYSQKISHQLLYVFCDVTNACMKGGAFMGGLHLSSLNNLKQNKLIRSIA